jgi:DNA-binding GntR family transcriptional regulator
VETVTRYPDLDERTYQAVEQAILRGQLVPGTEIVVVNLARELGVSRSPVKHALARLCGEGLAVKVPGKGYCVSRVDGPEIRNLFDARLLLEVGATEQGVTLATETDLALMRALVGEMATFVNLAGGYYNYLEFVERDKKLHTLIVETSKNRYLVQAHRLLNFHFFQARMHFIDEQVGEARAVPALQEHQAILAAFESRNIAEAKETVTRHIWKSMAIFGDLRELAELHRYEAPGKV